MAEEFTVIEILWKASDVTRQEFQLQSKFWLGHATAGTAVAAARYTLDGRT
jgi:hypothetical protein